MTKLREFKKIKIQLGNSHVKLLKKYPGEIFWNLSLNSDWYFTLVIIKIYKKLKQN